MWKTNSRKFRVVADKRRELEAKNFSKYTAKFQLVSPRRVFWVEAGMRRWTIVACSPKQ